MKENNVRSFPGIPALLVLLAGLLAMALLMIQSIANENVVLALVCLTVGVVLFVLLFGLYMVEPNQAAVLSLFGRYVGTVKEQGLRWNNPFYAKKKISLRVRNFESSKLKVNDLEGSPIEIASVVVWQVVDSAEAVYNVDDYESFVHIQSESALRAMAPTAARLSVCQSNCVLSQDDLPMFDMKGVSVGLMLEMTSERSSRTPMRSYLS